MREVLTGFASLLSSRMLDVPMGVRDGEPGSTDPAATRREKKQTPPRPTHVGTASTPQP